MTKDTFGNRIKSYESKSRFMPLIPTVVRIDGKCFSEFTKGLQKPFDINFIHLMIETTIYLAKETNARIGYTQSDEINLILYEENYLSELPFGGKKQKLISVLASSATAFFNANRGKYLSHHREDELALFDCRAFQVPNKTEAANAILWRERDAFRNSVHTAARYYFSHKELLNKSSVQLQELLYEREKINFNDYPSCFKRGTFIQKRQLSGEKKTFQPIQMPSFISVINREDVIFNETPPILNSSGNDD